MSGYSALEPSCVALLVIAHNTFYVMPYTRELSGLHCLRRSSRSPHGTAMRRFLQETNGAKTGPPNAFNCRSSSSHRSLRQSKSVHRENTGTGRGTDTPRCSLGTGSEPQDHAFATTVNQDYS
jgi:hypothetical protein